MFIHKHNTYIISYDYDKYIYIYMRGLISASFTSIASSSFWAGLDYCLSLAVIFALGICLMNI